MFKGDFAYVGLIPIQREFAVNEFMLFLLVTPDKGAFSGVTIVSLTKNF